MKLTITSYGALNWYVDLLRPYNFDSTVVIDKPYLEFENEIIEGTIDIENLEDLEKLSFELYYYFNKKLPEIHPLPAERRFVQTVVLSMEIIGNQFALQIKDGH